MIDAGKDKRDMIKDFLIYDNSIINIINKMIQC